MDIYIYIYIWDMDTHGFAWTHNLWTHMRQGPETLAHLGPPPVLGQGPGSWASHMYPYVCICVHMCNVHMYPMSRARVPCPVSRVPCPVSCVPCPSRVPCPCPHVPCPVSLSRVPRPVSPPFYALAMRCDPELAIAKAIANQDYDSHSPYFTVAILIYHFSQFAGPANSQGPDQQKSRA